MADPGADAGEPAGNLARASRSIWTTCEPSCSTALNALQFLHANGVVHGDVKPSNMLLDAHNRLKLGDFGLARRASNPEGSLLKGTTKYMAPELISSQFGPVGPASDLYSLGFAGLRADVRKPVRVALSRGSATFGATSRSPG